LFGSSKGSSAPASGASVAKAPASGASVAKAPASGASVAKAPAGPASTTEGKVKGKPEAEAAAEGKGKDKADQASGPPPKKAKTAGADSPASVVSKAASPLAESGGSQRRFLPVSPLEPQPLYHFEQKVLALRPDIGMHRTAWVLEVIFKTSVASEHHYLLSFSKHKQFDKIPIKESDIVAHEQPGACLQFMRNAI